MKKIDLLIFGNLIFIYAKKNETFLC